MLFKEELAKLIVEGVKTQTRRPIKAGEALVTIDGVKTVTMGGGKRIKYQVGREYSIQYGRGLPTCLFRDNDAHLLPLADYLKWQGVKGDYNGVSADVLAVNEYIPLKIKLLDVWAEDVRYISHEDSLFEGFSCADEFLVTWAKFYDDKLYAKWIAIAGQFFATWTDNDKSYTSRGIKGIHSWVCDFSTYLIANRAKGAYGAWALKFEVVRP